MYLYIYFGNVLWLWSGELLIPRSERELRRSEGSGMLIGDPLGEGSSASFYQQRAPESGELIPQNERVLRRSEGSGVLIGDPLGEGSNASSTNKASDLS